MTIVTLLSCSVNKRGTHLTTQSSVPKKNLDVTLLFVKRVILPLTVLYAAPQHFPYPGNEGKSDFQITTNRVIGQFHDHTKLHYPT